MQIQKFAEMANALSTVVELLVTWEGSGVKVGEEPFTDIISKETIESIDQLSNWMGRLLVNLHVEISFVDDQAD